MLGGGLRAQLLRGGIGSAGVQVINRGLSVVLGVVLARGLGAVGYGIYAYAFAIMNLLMVCAEAGMPILLMREVASTEARAEWGVLRGALIRGGQLVLVASTSISIGGLIVLFAVADSVSTTVLYTTGLMLLVLPPAALARTAGYAIRGLRRVVIGQAVDMLLRPSLVLLIVGLAFLAFPSLRKPEYAMTAQLGAALIVSCIGVCVLKHFLPLKARAAPAQYRTSYWIKSALPFILIGGAGVINGQTDIIMLGWFRPAAEVGIYRVAAQGGVLVVFFLNAAGSALAPYFAKMYSSGDSDRLRRLYRTVTIVVILVSLPIALALIAFSGTLISFVFGSEYARAALPLSILAVGYLLNAVFGPVGALLQMVGRERPTAKLLWLSAVLNVILNLILIPPYGAAGGALSTAFTVATYHAALRYIVRRDLGF